MLGRDVNLQKARELSLSGDLEGLQKEIVDIVCWSYISKGGVIS